MQSLLSHNLHPMDSSSENDGSHPQMDHSDNIDGEYHLFHTNLKKNPKTIFFF